MRDALERFRAAEDGSARIREAARDDVAFGRLGQQWPEMVRKDREAESRPCLTINRMPSFIRQVVNDGRANKPGILVHPVEGGDTDTARVIGGLIRSIERGSNAQLAYDHALDCAVSGGFGFFRVTTDYCHPESFDQEARIDRIANPFSVHWDTSSTAFDASDWEFAFVSEMMPVEAFKKRFPKARQASWQEGLGEGREEWLGENSIRLAEYWLREETRFKIIRLSDGRVVRADALERRIAPGMPSLIEMLALTGVEPVAERETTGHKVTRRLINGADVLEEVAWPGTIIPICPVWGEEVFFDGERHFRSLIRDAREPQQMFNYWRTAETELVALAPKAPFIAQEGAIPADEEWRWSTANNKSHPFLIYAAGAPMPQRQPFAGIPAGALQSALNASDDMKAVMGIYDASLGARSNETSGRAITARQRQADIGTFHFIDNLSRAIQYCGRVLIEIIPSLYSARQAITILGADEAEEIIQLRSAHGVAPSADAPEGKLYDLSTGRYDVTVKVGPSYSTQREEAVTALLELGRSAPATSMALADIAVKNMAWPGADEAAARLQIVQMIQLFQAVPPQVVAQLPEDMPGIPPMARQVARMLVGAQAPPVMPPPGGINDPMMGAPAGALPVSGAF
jgi:hypothetical protein